MITILQVQGNTASYVSSINSNFSNVIWRSYSNVVYATADDLYSQNVIYWSSNSATPATFNSWREKYTIAGANSVSSYAAHYVTVNKTSTNVVSNAYIYRGDFTGSFSSFPGNTYGTHIVGESNNFYSSNNLYLGSSSITSNGYSYLPNGLLLQWGSFTLGAALKNTVSFPIPYVSNCFVFNSNANNSNIDVSSFNKNSANIISYGTTTSMIYWNAIGF